MKIKFDPMADAMYIQLAEGDVAKTEEVKPSVIFDYDAAGNVLGYVSKRAELPLKQTA